MVCTAARGGMKSVVEGYREDGLFDKWNIRLISPHDEGGIFFRIKMLIGAYFQFLYFLLFNQVTLVHCHAAMRGSFWRKSLFAMTAKAFGKPVFFHLHGSEMKSFYSAQTTFLKKLISWILSKQTKVIVLSKSWFDFVKSISPLANVEILSNYVQMPNTHNQVDKAKNNKTKILFLGYLGKRKGLYDLLPAFKFVIDKGLNAELILGGNGEIDKLKDLAHELKIDKHVDFVGWVSGKEKVRLLQEADIFVLPSHNEGLPMSLLEAMSHTLPVVTTFVGGIPELVRDGIDGHLFVPGDIAKLAEHLIHLVENYESRTKMGTVAKENVQSNFSKDVIFPKLNQLYVENVLH